MKPAAPPPSQVQPATGFTRRDALLAVSAISLVPGLSLAQTAPTTTATPASSDAAAMRVIKIRAEKIPQRLGTPEQPETTMFRLIETGPEGEKPENPKPENPKPANPASAASPQFPVFRGREGEAFALEIENRLDQPTAFHLRGSRGPNAEDGIPGLTTAPLAPGAKLLLSVSARQTGTFILAPALAGHVAEQNARGLHAAVIVEEKPAPATAQPAFDHDLVLALSDWRLDDTGGMVTDFGALKDAARIGRLGNKLVANGAAAPGAMVVRPGARLRIRMVNVSNARVVPLKVSGFAAEVYSIDSTPCQPFDPLKRTVILAPASRIEMVLQAPTEVGKAGAIEAKIGNGIPIFVYRTEGEPLPARGKLAALPDPGLPPAIRLQDAVRVEVAITGGIGADPAEAEPAALEKRFPDPKRVFSISSGAQSTGGQNSTAGQNSGIPAGFSGRPVASLRRGRVLVMALHNRTAWPQVIAVHGHAFRLLHPFDDGWEPYFLDTLYLAPNTTARIALIADNLGKWAIRSTIAEHFASGVATWFEVT